MTSHEEFFEESFDLTATHEQTSYPFSMRIPHKPCLPWSATTEYGKVEYGVRAEIKRPWYKLNKSVSILFTLNSRIDAHHFWEVTHTFLLLVLQTLKKQK